MRLSEFGQRCNKIGDDIVRNANTVKKDATRELVKELATHTPADVGTAISNWQVSEGASVSSILPAYVQGSEGSTKASNAAATIEAAESVISVTSPGTELHTQNNLPYIDLLNAGISSQAPAGFVESAIGAAKDIVRKARVLKP